MKIRIKFTKTGNMRFIGHLDILRYFQKLLRRAEVDVKYSEGFSPHPVMSFAQPLGLGDTSEGEYLDLEVCSSENSAVMLRRLNEKSCPEIQMLRYVKIADETRRSNAMSNVAAADYRILFRQEALDEQAMRDMLAQEMLVVKRKTKTKEVETDIRPMILSWEIQEEGLFVRLATGSAANCKPDTLIEAYDRFRGTASLPFACHFHRLEMYACKDGQFVPLYRLGEELL